VKAPEGVRTSGCASAHRSDLSQPVPAPLGIRPRKIKELADSILQKGMLQPVLLRAHPGDGYQLVAGERRWRAAQLAGLREVPAVLREFTDREMLEAAVIENVQRDDLNPIEEARSYQRLTTEFTMTQDELARAIGKSRVSITNALRLLKLPARSAGHDRKGGDLRRPRTGPSGVENPASKVAFAKEALGGAERPRGRAAGQAGAEVATQNAKVRAGDPRDFRMGGTSVRASGSEGPAETPKREIWHGSQLSYESLDEFQRSARSSA
jgi:ParB/RepB/Spo0J family partition protein